jgi:hypothetical protein
MKRKNKIFQVIAGLFLFSVFYSCEKNITVNVPQCEEKVVIEGSIDLNDYSMVFLTKNLPYFGVIDSVMIANLIIQDATVIVSNGSNYDTLVKTFNPNYFPPIFYKGTKIKGEVGKSYSLTVKALGKTFTAVTTIPAPPQIIDSTWFKTEPNQDSLGYLWSTLNDPPQIGNCYMIYTKRRSKDKIFVPVLDPATNDKFFNGQLFQFSIMRGSSSINSATADPEYSFYKIGDTVIVKFCSIDQATYDFWRTAEGEMYSNGDPFISPSQIVTNTKGGSLGVWGGYGTLFDTTICK